MAACVTELTRLASPGRWSRATSVFFGAARRPDWHPTCSPHPRRRPPRPGAEVTVECNPEDADPAHLGAYRRCGVNRLSFGLQSTNAHVLAGPRAAARARRGRVASPTPSAEAGFANWNLDLIFGGAGETRRRLATAPSTTVLSLLTRPPHLSAYALTVEPGHAPGRDPERHPDEDALARRYEIDRPGAGRRRLRAGRRSPTGPDRATACRHNRLYWDQGDYRGIGSAAHSHRDGGRWWNVRTPERYIGAIEQGRSPEAGREVLTREPAPLRGPVPCPAHAARRALGDAGPRRRSGRPGRAARRPGRAHRARPAAGQRGHHPPRTLR